MTADRISYRPWRLLKGGGFDPLPRLVSSIRRWAGHFGWAPPKRRKQRPDARSGPLRLRINQISHLLADHHGLAYRPCLCVPRAHLLNDSWAVRRECSDWLVILGRSHLEQVLAEYVAHYGDHRPLGSLDQLAPRTLWIVPDPIGKPNPTEPSRKTIFGASFTTIAASHDSTNRCALAD